MLTFLCKELSVPYYGTSNTSIVIDLECRASWAALKGIAAGMAQHRFIEARLRNIEYYHSRLSTLVGEEQATAYLCEVFEPKEGEQ